MKHAAKLASRGAGGAISSASSAHRISHAIAKQQAPQRKIRIVHVLAPEVIKTEARHFRDLVQRLTGKPAAPDGRNGGGEPASPEDASSSPPPTGSSSSCDNSVGAAAIVKAEVKEESSESSSSEGSGGYLRALGAEDGGCGGNQVFFQGLEDFLFSSCCTMDGLSF